MGRATLSMTVVDVQLVRPPPTSLPSATHHTTSSLVRLLQIIIGSLSSSCYVRSGLVFPQCCSRRCGHGHGGCATMVERGGSGVRRPVEQEATVNVDVLAIDVRVGGEVEAQASHLEVVAHPAGRHALVVPERLAIGLELRLVVPV